MMFSHVRNGINIFIVLLVWVAVVTGEFAHCDDSMLKLHDLDYADLVLQKDGSMKFRMKFCEIREFTSLEAKQCLKNNNIVFLGDSVTRYLYVSFIYFIANDKKLPNFVRSSSVSYPPSIAWEKDFDNWKDYYIYSNRNLNNVTSHSYEICDCYRADYKQSYREGVENRYFRTYIDGEMLSVSMLSFMGHFPTRITKILLDSFPVNEIEYQAHIQNVAEKICKASTLVPLSPECYEEVHKLASKNENVHLDQFFSDRTNNFERNVLSQLNMTHMIASLGHHGKLHQTVGYQATADEIKNSRKQWVYARVNGTKYYHPSGASLKHLPQFIWKESVPEGQHGPYNDIVVKEVLNELTVNLAKSKEAPPSSPLLGIMSGLSMSKRLSILKQQSGKSVNILDGPFKDIEKSQELLLLIGNKTSYDMHIRSALIDNLHFQPWFYNEVFNYMLNVMC